MTVFTCLIVAQSTRVQRVSTNRRSFRNRPMINIHDVAGIDCTGITDSSDALNRLTNTQDTVNYTIITIKNCALKVHSQWLIHGQQSLEIDLGETIRDSGNTAVIPGMGIIFGCQGVVGAVVRVDRSSNVHIHGGGIAAEGNGCTSKFNRSIETTNSLPGGYTQTALRLDNIWLTSNNSGTGLPGYVGLFINGGPNQERYELHQLSINCQNSIASVGIRQTGANADSTTLRRSNIHSCFRGVENGAGNISIYDTTFGANGTFGRFGPGGATLYTNGGCWPVVENLTVAEDSGQFLASGADNSGCQFTGVKQQVFINNNISFAAVDPDVYPFNIGNTDINWVVMGNNFNSLGAPVHNNTVIGSDSQGSNHGPLGYLFSIANSYDTTNFVQEDYNPNLGFQRGHFGGNDRNISGSSINREPLELWLQGNPAPFANQGFLRLKSNTLGGASSRLGFTNGIAAVWSQNWNPINSTQDDTARSSWLVGQSSFQSSPNDAFYILHGLPGADGLTGYLTITGNTGTVTIPGNLTSTLATGTAPFTITSTTPVMNLATTPTTYDHNGVQQTNVHVIIDRCTLRTSCTVMLLGVAAFTSSTSYNCSASDETGSQAINFTPISGSVFTLNGTGTDSVAYTCIGK